MTTRVYKYYCEPVSDADDALVREQIALGTDYRLRLVAGENACREAERALEDLDPLVKAARRRVGRWRAYARSLRNDDTTIFGRSRSDVAESAHARHLDALFRALKRRWADPDYVIERPLIWERAKVAAKAARRELGPKGAGLSIGSWQFHDEAHSQSCMTSRRHEPLDDHHRRDEGCFATRIEHKVVMTTADLVGDGSSVVRISPELTARSETNRAGRPRPRRFRELVIRTRVQGAGRSKVETHARFLVLMHRELPPGSVRWVRLHRERTGLRYRWSCQVVVADIVQASPVVAPQDVVGVDLGWRSVAGDGSMRVGFAVGSDGAAHEMTVPVDVLQREQKTSDLRSIRDRHTNDMRERIVAWRQTRPTDCWFVEATSAAHAWRRVARFVTLHRAWAQSRIAGDEDIFAAMEAWLKQDRHLLAWESHNSRRMHNQVKSRYAQWCARIADTYRVVGVEKLSSSDMTSGDGRVAAIARRRRTALAPFMMIDMLKRAVEKREGTFLRVDAAYTSQNCSACDAERSLVGDDYGTRTCSACGVVHDRDRNAAAVIRNRASAKARSRFGQVVDDVIARASASGKPRSRRTRKRVVQPLENVVSDVCTP